jgi:hypothetical protein
MKYFLPALLVTIFLAACTQTAPVITPNRENMLRKGKWKISGGTVHQRQPNGRDTSIPYVSLFLPACHQDDYIIFDSGTRAAVYSGGTVCTSADPEQIDFVWKLTNDNILSLYNGFNLTFADSMYVDPFRLDTLDATIPTFKVIYLPDGSSQFDTIWEVKYKFMPLANINIFNATITDFSQSEFTLNYSFITTYTDTNNLHQGSPINPPPLPKYHLPVVVRPDTMRFAIKFTNF